MTTLRKRVQNEVLTAMRLKQLMGTQREIMHYLTEFQPSARTDFKPYLRSVLEGLDEIGQEESANVYSSDWWMLSRGIRPTKTSQETRFSPRPRRTHGLATSST